MFKKLVATCAFSAALGISALSVSAAEGVELTPEQNKIVEEATPAEGASLPLHEFITPFAKDSNTLKTTTGGKLTSNVWLDSLRTSDVIDYQVSAQYDKTDHTNIKTTWFATIISKNTSKTATVTVNTNSGVGVSASTTTTSTSATTASKYVENTKGQSSASYRSNLAVQGNWEKVYLTNTASVWGGKYGSVPASYSAQVSVSY